ncbi:uncharacterized protein [Eurosta solidaginis]|uniref:uncharacterized protein n=1 Tax=Eurosta solidaginis TaxID=178769 RepID=UPI0035313171
MTMWQSGGMGGGGGHGSQNNPWMKLMGIVHKERRHAENVQSQSGSNERNLNQSKIVTTRQQCSRLLDLFQQPPEMVLGFTKCPKEAVNKFWENIANSIAPPTKDATTWKKVMGL